MRKTIESKRFAILGAIFGAILFSALPLLVDESISRWAPISYWVKIDSIEVSDLDYETMHQSIQIHRTVRHELNGYPRQELYLVDAVTGQRVEIFNVPNMFGVADYEKTDAHLTVLPFDFWERKGVADELRGKVQQGKQYQWIWVIEFVKPNGNTQIERYPTNTFMVK